MPEDKTEEKPEDENKDIKKDILIMVADTTFFEALRQILDGNYRTNQEILNRI